MFTVFYKYHCADLISVYYLWLFFAPLGGIYLLFLIKYMEAYQRKAECLIHSKGASLEQNSIC